MMHHQKMVMICTHTNMKAHSGMAVSPRNLSLILQRKAVLQHFFGKGEVEKDGVDVSGQAPHDPEAANR